MTDEIISFLQSRIAAGDFPSAAFLVSANGEVLTRGAVGQSVIFPEAKRASTQTIYDVASLTKPLVTALLLAILIERGELDPNESVGNLLNEFFTSENSEITVNELAMHTSGLPAWKPLYLLAVHPDQIAAVISSTIAMPRGETVVYSDLNFILLGMIIEKIAGKSLDDAANDEIFAPLGLSSTYFNPPEAVKGDIAASEKGNMYERQICIDQGFVEPGDDLTTYFRSGVIWGEVHDGNSFFMSGVSGHAGLFSTIDDVFEIAKQFLPTTTKLLKPDTCELFSTNFTPRATEHRSFVFQLASSQESTAGHRMSPQSFGHLGFTGTSLWIDPIATGIFILLTNRTHHHTLPFANINSVRRGFHDLAIELLTKKS